MGPSFGPVAQLASCLFRRSAARSSHTLAEHCLAMHLSSDAAVEENI